MRDFKRSLYVLDLPFEISDSHKICSTQFFLHSLQISDELVSMLPSLSDTINTFRFLSPHFFKSEDFAAL